MNQVYVAGLPYESSKEQLERALVDALGSETKISGINFPLYHDSGRSRGYAHVTFESKEDCERAVNEFGDGNVKMGAASFRSFNAKEQNNSHT